MCGINGFNFNNPDLIEAMNRATRHRGPDATASWSGDGMTLGHNRLAILDVSPRGAQPMWDAAREVVISFNGEIYNFQELREALSKTYEFRSTSDTEVLLYAYREWGIECVKKLNGIFAFALYDTRTRSLYLARDHVGVKPLYYFWDSSRLIFSSEIKAILCHDIPREVDRDAFNLFFHVLFVPEPHTMFQGIRKLPAGSYLRLSEGYIEIKKYWELRTGEVEESHRETVDEIARVFRDSVERQLVSDRPVGVFLSGGIDSTAVLGRVAECSDKPVETFSVGFDIPGEEEKFNADFALAAKTAALVGANHHPVVIRGRDIADHLSDIAWHLDEPNFNPTAGAMYLLSREAKKHVAVVLGGDGGDELFGGYPRYLASWWAGRIARMPAWMQSMALRSGMIPRDKINLPPDHRRMLAFLSQKDESLAALFAHSGLASRARVESFFAEQIFSTGVPAMKDFEQEFMRADLLGWLKDESLLRTDKMTMAFGLEARVPILDYRLVELSLRIPTRWKFSPWQMPGSFRGKDIWKRAVASYLPPHILDQKKRGWFTPMAKWVRGDLRDTVGDILSPAHLSEEFFNQRGVAKMWRDHLSGERYNLNLIWAIVMWQLWYNRFMKR